MGNGMAAEPRSEAERAEWARIDRLAGAMPRYVPIAGSGDAAAAATAGTEGKKDGCDSCGAADPRFRCSSCQGARYCSRRCQAYAWKKGGHKDECTTIKAAVRQKAERRRILEVSSKKDPLLLTVEDLRSELAWYKEELRFERTFCKEVLGATSFASDEGSKVALAEMLKETRSYFSSNMLLKPSAATAVSARKGRADSSSSSSSSSPATIEYLTNKQLLAVLVRLPRSDHATLTMVCKRWHQVVRDPVFMEARRACPLTGHSCLEQTVLQIGGCRASDYGPHVEGSMLDDRGCWVKIAPLIGRPVFNSTKAVFCRGEVYVVGGEHGGAPGTSGWSGNPCSCFLIWNPLSNRWRGGPAWPNARVHPTVVECEGRIFVMGGQTRSMMGDENPSCDRYDPATGTWSQIKPLPKGGRARSASISEKLKYCHMMGGCSVGPNVYLFGGQFDDGPCTNRVLRYDTRSDAWSTCRSMPGDRFFPECHAIGTEVYVLGGLAGPDEEVGTAWKYSTVDDEWTVLRDAPLTHSNPMVLLGKGTNARIASVPGRNEPGRLTYHPTSDTWKVGGLPLCPQGHLQGPGHCVATF